MTQLKYWEEDFLKASHQARKTFQAPLCTCLCPPFVLSCVGSWHTGSALAIVQNLFWLIQAVREPVIVCMLRSAKWIPLLLIDLYALRKLQFIDSFVLSLGDCGNAFWWKHRYKLSDLYFLGVFEAKLDVYWLMLYHPNSLPVDVGSGAGQWDVCMCVCLCVRA